MRKFELVVGGIALVVISASATLYIVNHPLRSDTDAALQPSPTVLEPAVKPEDILRSPSITQDTRPPRDDQTSPSWAHVRSKRETVIYPEWKPGRWSISNAVKITPNAGYIAPVWSPVGMDIAFTKTDSSGIFIVGPDGTGLRALTDQPRTGAAFSWNIDGMSLHVKDPDGQFSDLVVTGEKYRSTERQPQVFERDGKIFFQPEEGEPIQISGAQDTFLNPKLSRDEKKVLFLGRETGIYIAFIEDEPGLSFGKGANPSWLPDSSGIVYDIPVNDGSAIVDGDLWCAEIETRERTNLTNTPGVIELRPSVAPDGERIAYDSDGAIFVGTLSRSGK